MAAQDDIPRLLDELVRLQARAVRKSLSSQTDAILELNEAGFGPKRISELLGTSYGTVTVTLAKAKKRKAKKTRELEEQE
jgi:DNA-directed RNA polymerase specialized sigma24 family protein